MGRALRKLAGAEIDRLEATRGFFSSPLIRTRETIERARVAMGLSQHGYRLSDGLKELTFGDWEGLTWPEVQARDPAGAAARARDKWDFTPPNGESYAALAQRIAPWVEAIDRDLFVASHGGVAPAVAAENSIHQGRALLFAEGGFRWIG